MEVRMSEIISNIDWHNLNVEIIEVYGSNEIVEFNLSGIKENIGYTRRLTEIVDVGKICNMDAVGYQAVSLIEYVREDIRQYQKENREKIIKKTIRKVEGENYGW